MAEQRTHPFADGAPQWAGPPWRWWRRAGGPTKEEPGPGRWPWPSTLLVTAFVLVGSHFAARGQMHGREPLDGFGVALLVVGSLLLLWRWRHPVPVAFGTAAAALGYLAAGYPYGPVFLTVVLGCFSAVVSGHRKAAWSALGVLWAGHLMVAYWLYRYLPPAGDGPSRWQSELGVLAWALAVVAGCELVRSRREQWARERAERAQAARRRADEERLRIARELHDILAHSISVINVQAGVGLALLDTDPEQARTALTTIKTASKEALGEVRHVLDTLRAPGDAPRAPAPGLARLPELVEQAARAGLTVTVATEPTAGPRPGAAADPRRAASTETPGLPPGLDLAAFRIVQEALTNVVRHSGSRAARVRVTYEERAVRLRIDDDGPATGADAGGSGKGLAGMRERAAALGGTIDAGPRPDGGFRVSAVLPLKEDR